ncbi:MAG: hypothetical protein H7Y30_10305, partial [Pyrinomonadaceae bacterium]|nr:hypothetical protein [Pyrinomonadaceae bacterium]
MKNLFWCLLIIGFVLNADAVAQPELDTTFNSTGKAVFNIYNGAWKTLVQPDNKIVMVSGGYTQANGYFAFCTIRLNENGSLDTTFGNFGPPDNYGPPGSVFTRFGDTSTSNLGGQAVGLALQLDGKIIVAGYRYFGALSNNLALARYNPDGTLDSSFGVGGKVVAPLTPNEVEYIHAVAVQRDGKIVITGVSLLHNFVPPSPSTKYTQIIARYLANGTLDSSFGTGGVVRTIRASTSGQSIAIQPDGKILIGGIYWNTDVPFYAHSMSRFNTDGSLDTTWNGTGFSDIYFTAPQDGIVSDFGIRSLAIQQDGRIVALGGDKNTLLRFNTNGSLDTTFGSGGSRQALNSGDKPYDMVLSPGGRITVVGMTSPPQLYAVARYNPNGSRDLSFSSDGYLGIDVSPTAIDVARAVAVDSRGRIVIAGLAGGSNPINPFENSTFSAARLLAPLLSVAISGRADFDGDGRTDLSVFRPTDGNWYATNSSNNAFHAEHFGATGDLIAPGDYDGDGKTDDAVFRPANGYWYILNSSNSSVRSTRFGQAGDLPATGDFDADGISDIVVFRPSTGTFYLLHSTDGSFHFRQWGADGDIPVMGDYDGDAKSDFAVWRPSNGAWYILRSSDNVVQIIQFGILGDKPVPGDYNADGRADVAVFRPSNGTWYRSTNPATNYDAVVWGQNGDLAAPGDYDGDRLYDVAIFRPSNGAFYILQSATNAVRVEQ